MLLFTVGAGKHPNPLPLLFRLIIKICHNLLLFQQLEPIALALYRI
jgi:hypothetical protein